MTVINIYESDLRVFDINVGASRVKTANGLYYFGKIRRTDWLPVGGPGEPHEQVERSMQSEDEAENDYDEASSNDCDDIYKDWESDSEFAPTDYDCASDDERNFNELLDKTSEQPPDTNIGLLVDAINA